MTITITLEWYHAVLIALFVQLVYGWGYLRGWRTMRYTLEATQEKLNFYRAAADSLDQPYT